MRRAADITAGDPAEAGPILTLLELVLRQQGKNAEADAVEAQVSGKKQR